MRRRLDIQGLRALAILLIVLYHADLPFPGGFTGVDVFFVISGFVIAGTLMSEFESSGRMSLVRFYDRRLRRILPAPAVMLVFVALAGILADPAGTQHMSAMTGIAASLLGSNFYLNSLPTGYFDVSTQLNPLLHTWMLSVIAQIYAVFPLLLIAAGWLGRSRAGRGRTREFAFVIVALATFASFALSFAVSRGDQQLAFYASPTRVWEFGAGALLLLASPLLERIPVEVNRILGLAGTVAIGVSTFTIEQIGFRETAALLPVAGGCALVVAGTNSNVGVSRLLSIRPMVFVGDISYSLYLWHWPFIVFAKALWPNQGWVVPLAAAVSLLPSWLSYRYVENRMRRRSRAPAAPRRFSAVRKPLVITAACIALPVVANLGLLQAQEALSSTSSMTSWKRTDLYHSYVGRGCDSPVPLGQRKNSRCTWRVPGSRGKIVLLGDSNAGQFTEPVTRAGNRAGFDVTVATYSSCPYIGLRITRVDGESKRCPAFGTQSIDYLVRSRPSLVVLATRTDFYLQNPKDGLAVGSGDDFTYDDAEKAALWRQALRATLRRLNAAGVPVLLVHPIPVLPLDQRTCAVVRVLMGKCSDSESRSSVDSWLRRARRAEKAAVAGLERTWILDFENRLCGKKRCSSVKDGISLYRDSRHLSIDGSLYLAGDFERAIRAHAAPRS